MAWYDMRWTPYDWLKSFKTFIWQLKSVSLVGSLINALYKQPNKSKLHSAIYVDILIVRVITTVVYK